MQIHVYASYYFCVKNVKPPHFHDVIEIGNICFMLRKTFSDSQSSKVSDNILFDWKTENFDFVLFHFNRKVYVTSKQLTISNANVWHEMSVWIYE